MNQPYLEITYRRGKPLAAYLYLARREGDCVGPVARIPPYLNTERKV